MRVARFLGPRLAGQDLDERGFALHQEIECGVDRVEIVKLVEALGAGAEFARGLRAAKEQDAEESHFVAVEIEDFLEAMLEFGHAAVGGSGAGQAVPIERVQSVADRRLRRGW